MSYVLSRRSLERLATCEAPLQVLVRRAITRSPVDFAVLEGHRGKAKQNQYVANGTSWLPWPKSKHNKRPSQAVDLVAWVDGALSWDWSHYHKMAPAIKQVWSEMSPEERAGWELQWGYDLWGKDGPHWQLVRP